MSERCIGFEPVRNEDLPVLSDLMIRAFDADTRLHTDRLHDGPKGYDDGSLLRKICHDDRNTARKILADGDIIGFFSVIRKGGNCVLDLLFLNPDLWGRGIGSRVFTMIEDLFPDARTWTVETPEYSTRNLHFYTEKCGFVPVQTICYGEERSVLLTKKHSS